jgi:hypothetical protein
MRRRAAVVVFSLVVVLNTVTLSARPSQDPGNEPDVRSRVVRIVKQLVRAVLGDGLSVPNP